MDSIQIDGIEAFGFHGVYAHERENGQNFTAHVRLSLPLRKAGRSDGLADTVNYVEVIAAVREVLSGPAFDTLEAVAETASALILERFPLVCAVELTLVKPEAPIENFGGRVSVTLVRERGE